MIENVFCPALLIQITNFATNSTISIIESPFSFVRKYCYNLGSVLILSFVLALLSSVLSHVLTYMGTCSPVC